MDVARGEPLASLRRFGSLLLHIIHSFTKIFDRRLINGTYSNGGGLLIDGAGNPIEKSVVVIEGRE